MQHTENNPHTVFATQKVCVQMLACPLSRFMCSVATCAGAFGPQALPLPSGLIYSSRRPQQGRAHCRRLFSTSRVPPLRATPSFCGRPPAAQSRQPFFFTWRRDYRAPATAQCVTVNHPKVNLPPKSLELRSRQRKGCGQQRLAPQYT